jgi:hypothetical protein
MNKFSAEGLALVDTFWMYFWRQDQEMFAAKHPSAETVPPANGYTLWPVVCATFSSFRGLNSR